MRVLIFGTFDRLHPGHLFLLKEADTRGELFVVVARDTNVKRIKGKDPAESEEARKAAIEKAFPDAHVILGDAKDFLVPVKAVRPGIILLGYDQHLPPGVAMEDLPCPVERLPSFHPEQYKSSLM
ncbi:hypothetical protein A3D88_00480 [Candidatus Peribacteria bacterium RIFCSPHIGHO2_02_FULL_52_16]|nr:MAG: hypothetical protein A2706_01445 [Candidatus Peribacteria bacterium RIFCSPHIGHO2_01_FULL_51_35]OGJ61950.1 MAG: hypothetical protein A3D88_00480 [Candidatus Peribacteria bacterium RIFCSPHIGHO2_02_FULL_52_16]